MGKLVAAGGECVADVWWSPDLKSWTRAHDVNEVTGSSQVLAVAAGASGFVSAGSHNGQPAVVRIDAYPGHSAPEQADPIAFMVDAVKNNKPIEGITALDINIGVVEIIEAAKQSIQQGRPIKLPVK